METVRSPGRSPRSSTMTTRSSAFSSDARSSWGSSRRPLFNEARNILEEFVSIDDSSSAVRNAAVDIYRACRKSGLTIRSLVDCMIAAAAMLSDLPILARDRDFEAIARLHPIELAP